MFACKKEREPRSIVFGCLDKEEGSILLFLFGRGYPLPTGATRLDLLEAHCFLPFGVITKPDPEEDFAQINWKLMCPEPFSYVRSPELKGSDHINSKLI